MHLQIAVKRFQFVSSSLFLQYCEYYLLLNSMWNLFTVCDKCSFHLMFSVARTALPPPPLFTFCSSRKNQLHARYESCFLFSCVVEIHVGILLHLARPIFIYKNINFFGGTKREFEMNFWKTNDRNHAREKKRIFKSAKQTFFRHNFSLLLIFNF